MGEAYEEFIDIISFYLLFTNEAGIGNPGFEVTKNRNEDIEKMLLFFKTEREKVELKVNKGLLERSREKQSLMLGKGFFYEFSNSDIKKIQDIVNELRDLISASKLLTTDHQNRLLKRLENLQSELHKRTNNLDRFYGVIVDIGSALGRFGEKSKPFFDRLQQLGEIIVKVMEKAQGLPSGALPKLPLPGEEEYK